MSKINLKPYPIKQELSLKKKSCSNSNAKSS